MSKKVQITEGKLVDLIYTIVENTIKEMDTEKVSPKKVVAKPVTESKAPKVIKITEERLVGLVDKLVRKAISEKK